MHRLILTLGLSTLLWATAARTTPAISLTESTAAKASSAAEACAVSADPGAPSESEQQWQNAHHAIAVVTESVWKSAPVHAGLGATRIARIFEIARVVSSSDPPPVSAPLYLRHTPLLI
jgi:hypothetical protein